MVRNNDNESGLRYWMYRCVLKTTQEYSTLVITRTRAQKILPITGISPRMFRHLTMGGRKKHPKEVDTPSSSIGMLVVPFVVVLVAASCYFLAPTLSNSSKPLPLMGIENCTLVEAAAKLRDERKHKLALELLTGGLYNGTMKLTDDYHVTALQELGKVYHDLHRYEDNLAVQNELLKLSTAAGTDGPALLSPYGGVADALRSLGRYNESAQVMTTLQTKMNAFQTTDEMKVAIHAMASEVRLG